MKKNSLIKFIAALFVGGIVLASCTDTGTGTGPEISFLNDQNTTTLEAGVTQYTIAGTITSDVGLSSVRFSEVADNGDKTQKQLVESFTDKNNYQFQYSVTDINAKIIIEVAATDKDNIVNTKNFTINVTAGGPINSYSVTLGGGDNQGLGSFFASTGSIHVYKQSAATSNSGLIDLIYHYTSGGELYAPSNSSIKSLYSLAFSTYNTTKLKVSGLTGTQFDAVTDDIAIVSAASGASADMENVSTGDVLAFVTAAGKKGLIKVTAVTGDNSGSISFDVKVQQ